MLESREGQRVPDVAFNTRVNNEWVQLTTDDLFKGKNVILFALPGAFTPTCSSTHLPRYNELATVFKSQGIDDIICLSVNDPFVMDAWAGDQNAEHISMLPDGNGDFSRGMGMLVNKGELGFGDRSWRYSMLVRDGVIEKMFIEPDLPGDPFEVSDADTMLNYLAPEVAAPKRVSLIGKPGCSHCTRAKNALKERGIKFEEITIGSHGISLATLHALSGRGTTPQIFIEGEHIGGADDLENWLKSH